MLPEVEQRLAIAQQLATISGDVLAQYFRRSHLQSGTKTDQVSAIVTQADEEAEQAMVDLIQAKLPQDSVIREEGENISGESGYTWVLDPIDGTSSFVRGLPIFATLIGLVDENMQPVLGIANQPISGDRWQGVQGEQSNLNGMSLVNPYEKSEINLASACIASTTPLMFTNPEQQQKMANIYRQCQRTAFGGDCFNYLAAASGWTAMPVVIVEADLNFYDFCALIPILTGANYCFTDWQGRDLTPTSTEVVASPNIKLHSEILAFLQ
ncbi:histidinol-phosphatase [Synechocystis sp. FACHB-383]|uniref:histidinol-phosphatase n=1 Tax=Synechocystis sp. FACHB-383 TaxID=2692864 RepID=UPI00168552B7|nr:histidinol-phosphatase [Synechocystis sp. FACHB-383]MBD2654571.1 histidinol-phosphatase [Synechocystis sp. FACHB-383]